MEERGRRRRPGCWKGRGWIWVGSPPPPPTGSLAIPTPFPNGAALKIGPWGPTKGLKDCMGWGRTSISTFPHLGMAPTDCGGGARREAAGRFSPRYFVLRLTRLLVLRSDFFPLLFRFLFLVFMTGVGSARWKPGTDLVLRCVPLSYACSYVLPSGGTACDMLIPCMSKQARRPYTCTIRAGLC